MTKSASLSEAGVEHAGPSALGKSEKSYKSEKNDRMNTSVGWQSLANPGTHLGTHLDHVKVESFAKIITPPLVGAWNRRDLSSAADLRRCIIPKRSSSSEILWRTDCSPGSLFCDAGSANLGDVRIWTRRPPDPKSLKKPDR